MNMKERLYMKKIYFTITGLCHYYGSDFLEKGMKVKLIKEPDNKFDKEARPWKDRICGKQYRHGLR